ncbi:MAG: hypothetical protein JWM91_2598 [Rhodospirillales bacterium]|nr:hypothetical protein [Rhodospirillales bacterium]
MNSAAPLLDVGNLTVRYASEGESFTALHDVSFTLQPGRALGIVGESGSGKSSIVGAILGILGPAAQMQGNVHFENRDLATLTPKSRRAVLGKRIGSVFQDPFTSLNPALRVGRQIAEPMIWHLGLSKAEAMNRARSLLGDMGIQEPVAVANAFPHQLSGGMKQRVLIAAAMACEPTLLILDEPTTALDVTVESQILDLLEALRQSTQISLLFISHNLRVVKRVCDDVAVMYAGQIVEMGAAEYVLGAPSHPYTKGLLASLPILQAGSRGLRLPSISGHIPQPSRPELGCVFASRCPFSEPACNASPQNLTTPPGSHQIRCWKALSVGSWPAQVAVSTVAPKFRRGDALVNATDLRKSYKAFGGWAGWRRLLPSLQNARSANSTPVAVDTVSLSLSPGEVLGLVGESGCGKSSLGRLILQLLRQDSGSVEYDGANLGALSSKALQNFRREAQIVFQNVGSALNPRHSIGEALERPLVLFDLVPASQRIRRVEDLLSMVQLPLSYRTRFPHQLSGGERQRVAIARALATNPRFIVCDEPVSALDVSVQAAIVNLLADLRDEFGLAYLFISHDLAVVAQISDRIAVMYRGRICETGPTAEILERPQHPYTQRLLASAMYENPKQADRVDGQTVGTAHS